MILKVRRVQQISLARNGGAIQVEERVPKADGLWLRSLMGEGFVRIGYYVLLPVSELSKIIQLAGGSTQIEVSR
jgi:hypothetical protein